VRIWAHRGAPFWSFGRDVGWGFVARNVAENPCKIGRLSASLCAGCAWI
jgi:hypothetical protein